jgi:hypothetical protein
LESSTTVDKVLREDFLLVIVEFIITLHSSNSQSDSCKILDMKAAKGAVRYLSYLFLP